LTAFRFGIADYGLRPVGVIGAYAPEGFQIEKETARSTDSIT
jgi:hypothetical protein